jgi:phosphoglycerol transferase MdoB-like AlkP superfamily enzyme
MTPDRRLALAFILPPLFIGALLRMTLVLADPVHRHDPVALPTVLPLGLAWDLGVWTWLAVGPFLWLVLRRSGRWMQRAVLAGWIATVLIQAVVEWSFWDEFSSRFNHVAIDYLLYPKEVATNIWESFNVPLVLGLLVVVSAALGWAAAAAAAGPVDPGIPRRRTLGWTAVAVAGAAALLLVLPTRPSDDRELNEISGNGTAALVHAIRSASIDYPAMYATLPADRAAAVLAGEGATLAARSRPPAVHRDRPYDVLVVLEESLGAEFAKGWNGSKDLTPELDRWKARGTAFLDCVPTGNRTVRGLEAVLTGLPPVPPESVVKRPGMDGIPSLARAFAAAGHRTAFYYGGAGTFDNLGRFATAAGYEEFHDDPPIGTGAFPANAFRTAWGVADEHLFAAVLDRQRAAQARGEPLFLTALTVSNHKPFLVPGDLGQPRPTATKDLVKAGVALTIALAAVIALVLLRRQVGWTVVVAGVIVLAAGGTGYAWWRVGAKDDRTVGVRYADRAVGAYLDAARAAGVLDHTVVLVVGDHGARVYGTAEVPLPSYRVVALAVHPDPAWQGRSIASLCSQIDLPPTVCSLAGLAVPTPFPGVDLANAGQGPGRAFVQHNRNIGLLSESHLAVLGLKRERTVYQRTGPTRTGLARIPAAEAAADPDLSLLLDRAMAWFQAAEAAVRTRSYRMP